MKSMMLKMSTPDKLDEASVFLQFLLQRTTIQIQLKVLLLQPTDRKIQP